jgi:pyruvate,water dikinase
MVTIYKFPGDLQPEISEVGGKGWSLIRMSQKGLPVPSGFVLAVEFFNSWFQLLQASPEWKAFLESENKDLSIACANLKKATETFPLDKEQSETLSKALTSFAPEQLFAVRSSSPEEDLEGSSFAGGYETVLGVKAQNIVNAIRTAFASCLDNRVVVYKREHGFDTTKPKIAVVVQEQIASEIAGVGFSLNPINNNFDEAVFNANWGLGETVVAGIATPDTFVVDRISKTIKTKELGGKQTSIWLKAGGDTQEREDPRHNQLTLNDHQLVELVDLVTLVEKAYGKPIDIEWAYEDGKLYLLQARPITTYVPVAPEMMTEPGEQKRLYIDFTISTQGLTKPLSPMGISLLRQIHRLVSRFAGIPPATNCASAIAWIRHGRIYLNLSNLFNMAGKKEVLHILTNMDPLAVKTISGIDENQYKSTHTQKHFPWKALWELPQIGGRVLNARLHPKQAGRNLDAQIAKFFSEAEELQKQNLALPEFVDKLFDCLIHRVLKNAIPIIITSRIALGRMKALLKDADSAELQKLERGLPHNVTTQMGLDLYQVSQLLPDNVDEKSIPNNEESLGKEFSLQWQKFIHKYGHRGLAEIDVASSRFRDDPRVLAEQLVRLKNASTGSDNPQYRFDQAQIERKAVYEKYSQELRNENWLQLVRFQSMYRVVEELAGYRESHKFCLVFAIDLIRKKLLSLAQNLVKLGYLDNEERIFDLDLEDLGKIDTEPDSLMEIAKRNREFPDRLARVPWMPVVFDSRGLVIRPPAVAAKDGEVVGMSMSPGVVRGRVKVLHTCDEKPLERGEILVARATDPGWTPLFVNAAGVVLEIGGMLQHGALVAREYGLPCVSGVENATSLWQDGTLVEVDGSNGIVRTIEG